MEDQTKVSSEPSTQTANPTTVDVYDGMGHTTAYGWLLENLLDDSEREALKAELEHYSGPVQPSLAENFGLSEAQSIHNLAVHNFGAEITSVDTVSSLLKSIFMWDSSKAGTDYWEGVAEKYVKMETEVSIQGTEEQNRIKAKRDSDTERELERANKSVEQHTDMLATKGKHDADSEAARRNDREAAALEAKQREHDSLRSERDLELRAEAAERAGNDSEANKADDSSGASNTTTTGE